MAEPNLGKKNPSTVEGLEGLNWVLCGYMGIMEKKMETTIMGYIGIIGYILVYYRDNGKGNGNYYSI